MRSILCFEVEWKYNSQDPDNRFELNTELPLRCLKEFHGCEIVYRHILTREDLQHYLDYFRKHKREGNKYEIVYIACHGWHHSIGLEGDDGHIDLQDLCDMANGFFEGKIVHFGSCKTLANPEKARLFKQSTGARLVCGYELSVDAMDSAIADIALLNELQATKNAGWIANESSKFRQRYQSLLDDLGFVAY